MVSLEFFPVGDFPLPNGTVKCPAGVDTVAEAPLVSGRAGGFFAAVASLDLGFWVIRLAQFLCGACGRRKRQKTARLAEELVLLQTHHGDRQPEGGCMRMYNGAPMYTLYSCMRCMRCIRCIA